MTPEQEIELACLQSLESTFGEITFVEDAPCTYSDHIANAHVTHCRNPLNPAQTLCGNYDRNGKEGRPDRVYGHPQFQETLELHAMLRAKPGIGDIDGPFWSDCMPCEACEDIFGSDIMPNSQLMSSEQLEISYVHTDQSFSLLRRRANRRFGKWMQSTPCDTFFLLVELW